MSGQANNQIYYNIRITNDLQAVPLVDTIPAVFSETRVLPIIENPSEYEIAVVRFSVPTSSIPLFIWDDGQLGGALEYDGATVDFDLQHVANGLDYLYGRAVYSYQEIIESCNRAIATAYLALVALKPALLPLTTDPPQLSLNADTGLMSLIAPLGWDDEAVNPPLFYFNTGFGRFFSQSLQFVFNLNAVSDYRKYRVRIKNNLDNIRSFAGVDYFDMNQSFSTLALFNQFKNIVFQTDRIPVVGEFLTSFQRTSSGQLISSTGSNITRNILTDFEPLDSINNNTSIQYFPQGPIRYYPLKNKEEMRTVDVKVFWEDSEQRIFPVYLSPGDTLTMKLEFRRRPEKIIHDGMEGK